jgi:uncharacterized protein
MSERPPSDDDPIIRSIRDAGIRPIPLRPRGPGGSGRTQMPRNVMFAVAGIVLFVVLLVLIPAISRRLADWLWFREIGFERVFLTKVIAQWSLGLTAGLLALGFFYLTARVASAGRVQEADPSVEAIRGRPRQQETVRFMLERAVSVLMVPWTILLSFILALSVASGWRTLVQLVYRTPFGTVDPVFGRDIGYYIFTLPALELAANFIFALLLLSAGFVALPIHAFRGSINLLTWKSSISTSAQRQFSVLAGLLLVAMAIRTHFVQIPSLLFGAHGSLQGANWVDLHVRLPALHVLSLAALLGAALIVWGAARHRLVPVALRVVVGYVALVMLGAVIPAGVQRLVVQPNELAKETPQIAHHIRATRQAWGIDSVESRDLGTDTRLTPQLIAANRATIDNVRLWDREPLLQTFGQIQSIRTYYDFVSVDDDRYMIDGQLRQVMLSARELNTSSLPTRGFINEHLTYTHGMGVTLGPSNEVTPEGLPVLFIKDLPPVSSIPMRITRPRLYYGEEANDFVLAPSRQREFDYPAGEGDAAAYSAYDGRGGVPIGSFARRLLYAIRFGSLNILLSDDLTDSTRILYNRDVRARASRALPFLTFDRDPYLVITDDGQLKWLLDAYTVASRYPYAQRTVDGTNYMRNSVKVVIDAYDGSVNAYLADPSDPIIRTFARIYPGLLHPLDAMPANLRAHLRYPEDLFRLQTVLYATFHMADAETFYHREDQWQIPVTGSGASQNSPEAFLRHMVMRLPGEPSPEFILMRPFTPRQKDNLAAWMVARNDGEHYGKLAVYRFPRQSLVFGPNQIVNRINQDTEVSRQISLWDQRGSEVLRGELLVIPIEGSLIYVQPLYLRAQGGRIPELKRVVAAHEGQVAMEETLDAALVRLFGDGGRTRPLLATADSGRAATSAALPAGAGAAPVAATTDSLARRAREHYDRARAAQRADDWATYGDQMKKLGEVLQAMQARSRP